MFSNKWAVSGYTNDSKVNKTSQNDPVNTTNGGIMYLRK